MQHVLKIAALTAMLMLQGCGKSDTAATKEEAKAASPGITLTAEQRGGLDLATAMLAAVSYSGQLSGYGVVVAMDSIAQSDADLITAASNVAQSAAAAARAKALSTGEDAAVSRETYETAAAKASGDQAALALAQRKADATFGIAAPWHNGANRAAIMTRLQSGGSVLVRVTFPMGANVSPNHLTITRMGAGSKRWMALTTWEAPADPAVPGHSFFALVDGSGLAQGERVIASIPTGAPQSGVIVPAAALLLGENDSWAYVKTAAQTYLRTRIDTSHPDGDGYFVTQGLKPGQEVVTRGAGQLYAFEINPNAAPEE